MTVQEAFEQIRRLSITIYMFCNAETGTTYVNETHGWLWELSNFATATVIVIAKCGKIQAKALHLKNRVLRKKAR